MGFFTEWMLAIHRAIWVPVLWFHGLESPAVGYPWLEGTPAAHPPQSARRKARKTRKPIPLRRAA